MIRVLFFLELIVMVPVQLLNCSITCWIDLAQLTDQQERRWGANGSIFLISFL